MLFWRYFSDFEQVFLLGHNKLVPSASSLSMFISVFPISVESEEALGTSFGAQIYT